MSSNDHKNFLLEDVNSMMTSIDKLPLHPRNKLLVYHRYVLSMLSWNLTIENLSETWVKPALDTIVHKYVREWLEIPISGTLDIISLSKEKFGLGFISVSTRYMQCQSTIRNC